MPVPYDLSVEAGELGSVHGAARGLPPRDAGLVRAELRRADARAGAGWPAIAGGGHVLIQAPTGSGKTLAAFLSAIDRLTARPGAGLRSSTSRRSRR